MEIKETKIKSIIYNEISFIIAGIGLVSSVIFWVMNPQQDLQIQITRLESQIENNEQVGVMLQKFKDNDLHELQLRTERVEQRQIEILQAMARLEILLENKRN